jgi:hypothetical protein
MVPFIQPYVSFVVSFLWEVCAALTFAFDFGFHWYGTSPLIHKNKNARRSARPRLLKADS